MCVVKSTIIDIITIVKSTIIPIYYIFLVDIVIKNRCPFREIQNIVKTIYFSQCIFRVCCLLFKLKNTHD